MGEKEAYRIPILEFNGEKMNFWGFTAHIKLNSIYGKYFNTVSLALRRR